MANKTKYPRPTAPSQPTTGQRCDCRPGVWRDNCPRCEATGWVIDFRAIHAARAARQAKRKDEDMSQATKPDAVRAALDRLERIRLIAAENFGSPADDSVERILAAARARHAAMCEALEAADALADQHQHSNDPDNCPACITLAAYRAARRKL